MSDSLDLRTISMTGWTSTVPGTDHAGATASGAALPGVTEWLPSAVGR